LLAIVRDRRLPAPEFSFEQGLVRFEAISIRDDVLAPESPAAADVGIAVQVDLAAADAGDPRPQHRDQPRFGDPRRLEEVAHAVELILLDVDQEHVGAAALELNGELRTETR